MSAIESAAVLNGRYHVLRPVGRGGMGAVYEAIDLRLRNTVAVKKMTAEGAEAQRAFEREGQLLAVLRHRALPVVIDYFIEDGACYLVMQFIEGEDLAALVRRGGGCAEKDVQRWAAEMLAALVYLHGLESPVIHRDIKPANIKLTPRGDVVLLDFGLAKGQPASATRRGDDQSIYGFTPNYAPPEQLQFQHTDARSDLYALGATLYHLVSGAAPPSAVDRSAAMGLGREDPLTTATSAATVSAPFAAVLLRAMAIDPAARFASAADMLSALTTPSSPADTQPARPQALLTPPPSRQPSTRTRRLDAATPSRAELERPVDVLVQVRFADSPLLGLEDWPTRRKPDRIEQASEPVRIEHAVDPSTGRLLPARLRIKLVAPDFDIRGASEQLIDVAPEEYSQRVAFLMTPRRLGHCRVNVEVYAADTVYLGAIGIESEIVSEGARQAPLCTADLVMDVAARESSLAPPTVALQPVPMAEARLPTSLGSQPSMPAGAPRPDASDPVPHLPPRSSFRVRTLGLALSAAAVLMIAVQVQRSLNTTPDLAAPDAVQPTAPPPDTKSAPTTAAGTPQATAPPPPPAMEPDPPPAATPRPRRPPGRESPDAAARGPAAGGSSAPSRPGVESSSHPGVTVELVAIERQRSGVVRVRSRLVNNSAGAVRVGVDRQRTTLADRQGRSYAMVGPRDVSDSTAALAPGRSLERSFDFAVPDTVAGGLILTLAPASPYAARFPALVVRVPSR